MDKCQSKGCTHAAKVVPQINVPAMHWSVEQHQPLACIMNLMLCEMHFAELEPADVFLRFDIDGKNNMREMFELLARGKQPPDFDRAWISKISMGSKRYKDFAAAAGEKRA